MIGFIWLLYSSLGEQEMIDNEKLDVQFHALRGLVVDFRNSPHYHGNNNFSVDIQITHNSVASMRC